MKKFLLIYLLVISFSSTAQSWQWSNSAGGTGNDYATRICKDLSGNYYIGGYLNEYVSGNGVSYFKTDTVSVNGFNDLFIAKYDANGNEIWVKSFGGANTNMINITAEGISDIYFDSLSNSIYISGAFYGSCSFDTITLTSCGGTEMFFARYDLNGNCLWAKKSCGITDNEGGSIIGDNSGNLYITGGLYSSGNFDTITLPSGLFLAKYDTDGNIYWAKKISDIQFGIVQYAPMLKLFNNNIYMSGRAYTDNLTIDTMTFEATNYKGMILTKWDLNGNILWGKRFGGPARSYGSIDIDINGNFYITGRYDTIYGSYVVFDNDTINGTGAYGGFLTKFNSSGNKVWVKEINSSQYLDIIICETDGDGNTYITSSFADTIFFGTSFIKANASEDAFVARYDSAGNILGTVTFGEGHGYDVTADANGVFTITGYFAGNVNLGSSLSSYGGYDIFIAKHDAITRVEENERTINNQLYIYANPNKGTCTITIPDEFYNEKNLLLQIYDNAGKLLQQSKIEIQQDKIKVNIEAEARGVYPVVLTNGKKSYSGKIVFE